MRVDSLSSQVMSQKQGEFLVLSSGSLLRCHVYGIWLVRYLEMVSPRGQNTITSFLGRYPQAQAWK